MAKIQENEFNVLELLQDGKHFAEKRADGLTHIVDSLTGRSVLALSDPASSTRLVPIVLGDGTTCHVQEGTNPQALESRRESVFSPLVIDLICQEIVNGKGITQICTGEYPFPTYTVFCRWKRSYPWIQEALTQARQDRAEQYRDRAMTRASGAKHKDDVPGATLEVETLKWAAGVDDARYSPKAKVEATLTAPTQIIVHTNIPRDMKEAPVSAGFPTLPSPEKGREAGGEE